MDPRKRGKESMKNTLLTVLMVITGFVVAPQSAYAHHGRASFDSQAPVTFKATVTDFHFVNPHSVVEFEVKDDQGQIHKWQGQLGSASRLAPRGWTAASLEAGQEITITGYRANNGSPALWVTKIVLASGEELKMGPAGN